MKFEIILNEKKTTITKRKNNLIKKIEQYKIIDSIIN
jgi:hypothetical protein